MDPVQVSVGGQLHLHQAGQRDDLDAGAECLPLIDRRRRKMIIRPDLLARPNQVDGLSRVGIGALETSPRPLAPSSPCPLSRPRRGPRANPLGEAGCPRPWWSARLRGPWWRPTSPRPARTRFQPSLRGGGMCEAGNTGEHEKLGLGVGLARIPTFFLWGKASILTVHVRFGVVSSTVPSVCVFSSGRTGRPVCGG